MHKGSELDCDWVCCRCTYCHKEGRERGFLACAVCGAERAASKRARTSLEDDKSAVRVATAAASRAGTDASVTYGVRGADGGINRLAATCSAAAAEADGTAPAEALARPPQCATTALTVHSLHDLLRPRRASSFAPPPTVRVGASQPTPLSVSDLSRAAPAALVLDALPMGLAMELLRELETQSSSWRRGQWRVRGQLHVVPRTTAAYTLDGWERASEYGQQPQPATTLMQQEGAALLMMLGHEFEHLRPASKLLNWRWLNVDEAGRAEAGRAAAVCCLHCGAAAILEKAVHELRPTDGWKPTFILANKYANGNECVGPHADHLMDLGPRPIIVGLSLGATRRFELKEDRDGPACTVQIPLPHNSALVMWDEAQESWTHSVPRCSDSAISPHPAVGKTRYSLTFRMRRQLPDFGLCHCGKPAALKAKRGDYFLFCRPYGDAVESQCNLWKPCKWAYEEAQRRRVSARSHAGVGQLDAEEGTTPYATAPGLFEAL